MKKENIDPDDLLGDITPEINPEKLFDEKEYVTLVVGGEDASKKDVVFSDLIAILTSSKATREEKDEALAYIKEKKGQSYLIQVIKKAKSAEQKAQLIAACWETGLDFSVHFPIFIDLICENNFIVSLEAFTVIEEMETLIDPSILTTALEKLKKVKEPMIAVTDAIELIERKLNAE